MRSHVSGGPLIKADMKFTLEMKVCKSVMACFDAYTVVSLSLMYFRRGDEGIEGYSRFRPLLTNALVL